MPEMPEPPNPTSSLRASLTKGSSLKKPRSIVVGKAGGSRKGKRPSLLGSPSKVEAAYETEVMPMSKSLLPNTFALPPPSPLALFPKNPALPPSETRPSAHAEKDMIPQAEASPRSTTPTELAPQTPRPLFPQRPFPVAKNLAPGMVHAYSPVRPSPLSRITRLEDSTDDIPTNIFPDPGLEQNTSTQLDALREEDEEDDMFPEIQKEPEMTLAEELGVSESPPESPVAEPPKRYQPESPLREKRTQSNMMQNSRTSASQYHKSQSQGQTAKGRLLHAGYDKMKPKPGPAKMTKAAMKVVEKENGMMKRVGSSVAGIGGQGPRNTARATASSLARQPPPRVFAKPSAPLANNRGPRKVPVGSEEAGSAV